MGFLYLGNQQERCSSNSAYPLFLLHAVDPGGLLGGVLFVGILFPPNLFNSSAYPKACFQFSSKYQYTNFLVWSPKGQAVVFDLFIQTVNFLSQGWYFMILWSCLAQCNALPTSAYLTAFYPFTRHYFCDLCLLFSVCFLSLECNFLKGRNFSMLFIAASQVPGTWEALNKYSLNERTNIYRRSSVRLYIFVINYWRLVLQLFCLENLFLFFCIQSDQAKYHNWWLLSLHRWWAHFKWRIDEGEQRNSWISYLEKIYVLALKRAFHSEWLRKKKCTI